MELKITKVREELMRTRTIKFSIKLLIVATAATASIGGCLKTARITHVEYGRYVVRQTYKQTIYDTNGEVYNICDLGKCEQVARAK